MASSEGESPEYQKNRIRFELLVTLPMFQRDIKKLRRSLNIPDKGFASAEDYSVWYVSNLDRSIGLPTNAMQTIGEKYKLPAHFYDGPLFGLYPYIVLNRVAPPSYNWVVEPTPVGKRGTAKWISIRTYAPLSGKELKQAKAALGFIQKTYFPKELNIDARIKQRFDRDLQIYKELKLNRKKKPVKRKEYFGYLALLPPEKRKEWEKMHPDEVRIHFDELTAREVGRKYRMTPDAVRKSIERIDKLIVGFFGEITSDIKGDSWGHN